MKSSLKPHEQIIKEGAANIHHGPGMVQITSGGKLYLTNQRLVFEQNKANIKTNKIAGAISNSLGGKEDDFECDTEISLTDIQTTELCWTKLFGIPIFPNSLAVHTKSGVEYRFVLFERKAWATAIDANIKSK